MSKINLYIMRSSIDEDLQSVILDENNTNTNTTLQMEYGCCIVDLFIKYLLCCMYI